MGRHVAGNAPEMDRLVGGAIKSIGAEIDALAVPRLLGVVLGGGYGRGEGGVFVARGGRKRLSNDLDFYVVAEDGSSRAQLDAIGSRLAPVAARWKARLGVDVDFCPAKTQWRMRHDQERVMIQELIHGYFDVAGLPGGKLFAGIERREPSAFPWSEAARLLVNRGVGLLLAAANDDRGFVLRNINKCVLGAGDAALIVRGDYRWKATDRADALGDRLYSAAVEWKFRPGPDGVCDWETAREVWLKAVDAALEAGRRTGAMRRTVYQAARWIVRRRSIGDWRTLGCDAVARMLLELVEVVRGRRPLPQSLRRDWEIFN